MESAFFEITSAESFEKLWDDAEGFHDSLVREIGILARGYVTKDRCMHGDCAPRDMRMVIHSQCAACPCIEILFEDLRSLSYQGQEISHPSIECQNNELLVCLHGDQFFVRCSRMRYRILDKGYLGKAPRTVTEILPYDEEFEPCGHEASAHARRDFLEFTKSELPPFRYGEQTSCPSCSDRLRPSALWRKLLKRIK